MDAILKEIKANPYLKLIARQLNKYPQEFYLVGGYPRDLFLKRKKEVFDFDFALSASAIKTGREIAKSLKSGFVVLDEEHGSCRIVYNKGGQSCNFDFTDFRGQGILEDLLHRDFTVNSLGLDLKALGKAKKSEDILIDRYGALRDIKNRTIRVISELSFTEDPLRILRAYSLSAVLDFRIEPKTKILIKKHKDKITSSASERVSEELFKILNSKKAFATFKAMADTGVLNEIIPEVKAMRKVSQGPYHHLDVYRHCFEALKQIERLFEELKRYKDIQLFLNRIISGTHTKRALLKFSAFLHDIGKPVSKEHIKDKVCFHGHERTGRNIVRGIAERLRLSNDERNALDKIIFWHLRPGYLADLKDLSRRAVYRYFRDTQNEAVSVVLLSIADQRSTRGPLTRGANRKHHEDVCLGLAKDFFRKSKKKKFIKLINGNDLMAEFKLESGPLIGKLLIAIEESQAVGDIRDKAQAFVLAKKLIKKERQK
ncbi:MAG: HD domain-containing protein [Candidatus Omnitrophota bacterium]|nr:HD domain-containing protein [Candidatus Omnitrophota bacterium]